MTKHLWIRDEIKKNEYRTPLVPKDIATILASGFKVSVEESKNRIFKDQEYAQIGATLVPSGSWVKAPRDAIIIGLKELPEHVPTHHTHIYFAHCFKGQEGSIDLLRSFKQQHGKILDLEFLVDENGKRLVAFGRWAGFVGAALGLEIYLHLKKMRPFKGMHFYQTKEDYVEEFSEVKSLFQKSSPKILVMGSNGRCGQGAKEFFDHLELSVTGWDREETKAGGPFAQILDFDLFINCALLQTKVPPFITKDQFQAPYSLSVISDVSCDPNNPDNPIPLYDAITTWGNPYRSIDLGGQPLAIQAVDHLPTVLPRESSEEFSYGLTPLIQEFSRSEVWTRAQRKFEEQLGKV